jgi:hypothetical protein
MPEPSEPPGTPTPTPAPAAVPSAAAFTLNFDDAGTDGASASAGTFGRRHWTAARWAQWATRRANLAAWNAALPRREAAVKALKWLKGLRDKGWFHWRMRPDRLPGCGQTIDELYQPLIDHTRRFSGCVVCGMWGCAYCRLARRGKLAEQFGRAILLTTPAKKGGQVSMAKLADIPPTRFRTGTVYVLEVPEAWRKAAKESIANAPPPTHKGRRRGWLAVLVVPRNDDGAPDPTQPRRRLMVSDVPFGYRRGHQRISAIAVPVLMAAKLVMKLIMESPDVESGWLTRSHSWKAEKIEVCREVGKIDRDALRPDLSTADARAHQKNILLEGGVPEESIWYERDNLDDLDGATCIDRLYYRLPLDESEREPGEDGVPRWDGLAHRIADFHMLHMQLPAATFDVLAGRFREGEWNGYTLTLPSLGGGQPRTRQIFFLKPEEPKEEKLPGTTADTAFDGPPAQWGMPQAPPDP